MCGLVGVAADTLSTTARDLFRSLLIVDSLRGIHGTGVGSVGPAFQVDYVKRAGPVFDLTELKYYDRVVGATGSDKRVLMGHNRSATFGAHTTDNAHPFDFKHVIGMHNGTVEYSSKWKMHESEKFDTDSEAIYSHINNLIEDGKDWKTAITETVGLLSGAWAFVMWIKGAKKLVFLRNKERPLYYCYAGEKKYLVWASEPWMLYSMLAREKIKIDEETKVAFLNEDTIYSWSLPESNKKWEPAERTKCLGKEPIPVIQSNFTRGWSGADYTGTRQHAASSTNLAPAKSHHHVQRFPNENHNKKTSFKNPYKDWTGKILTKPDFVKLINAGDVCCYCNSHTPKWGEAVCFIKPSPVGSPQYLCKMCIEDEQILEIAKAVR